MKNKEFRALQEQLKNAREARKLIASLPFSKPKLKALENIDRITEELEWDIAVALKVKTPLE
jgi:hypothetical protein